MLFSSVFYNRSELIFILLFPALLSSVVASVEQLFSHSTAVNSLTRLILCGRVIDINVDIKVEPA